MGYALLKNVVAVLSFESRVICCRLSLHPNSEVGKGVATSAHKDRTRIRRHGRILWEGKNLWRSPRQETRQYLKMLQGSKEIV